MSGRLPDDAFEYYVAQGPDRSYQAVADHFDVAKVTVTRHAKAQDWQGRIRELETKARERSDQKVLEAMEVVRERHLKSARMLQAKALEALSRLPAEKALKAAQALAIGWKHELLILGEPTERQSTIEETIRREYERWMGPEDGEDEKLDDEAEQGVADGEAHAQ